MPKDAFRYAATRSRAAFRGQLLPPPDPTSASIVLLSMLLMPEGPHGPVLKRSVVTNGLVPSPPAATQSGSATEFQRLMPKPPCQKPGVQPSPHGSPTTVAEAVSEAAVAS